MAQSASFLAPPSESELSLDPSAYVSGLDGLFFLSLASESEAVHRAAGRRVDPETGRVFHAETCPPPTTEPGLLARLEGVPGPSNDAAAVAARVASFRANANAVREWAARFPGLLAEVDGDCALEEALERGRGCVERLKEAREAAGEVKAAARGEGGGGVRCKSHDTPCGV